MEEKLVRWPDGNIQEELGQAEDITKALLAGNLKVLESYFLPFAVHQQYCEVILPKYYTGERLVHEVYQYLSQFFTYEAFINENLHFIMSVTLKDCSQKSVSKVLYNLGKQHNRLQAIVSPFLKSYLHKCVMAALNQYAPLMQLKDIKVEVDETDRTNGLMEFLITYVFIPTNTRHNYVFPFYISERIR